MIYVQDLVVEGFACTGLLKKDYAIQISAFENIRLENLYITGEKDGVHLGWGRGFVIRHGRFCTFDDPIALNAFDYSVSNPHVGWIEDGLIEDCTDLPADSTTGFFCRILGGAWCDWFPGMQVQHSDTVCRDGRVYRVVMQPDGTIYTSDTPPCHESGVQTYDGIHWVCVRNEPVYDCGCRNIVLRDIRLQKKRGTAVGISLNRDAYAQSCYPHSKPVPQAGITLEKIRIENGVVNLIGSNYPTGDITVADTDLKEAKLCFRAEEIAGIGYPEAHVTLRNVIRKEDSIYSDGKHPVFVTEVR
jgi:hypothetical protein